MEIEDGKAFVEEAMMRRWTPNTTSTVSKDGANMLMNPSFTGKLRWLFTKKFGGKAVVLLAQVKNHYLSPLSPIADQLIHTLPVGKRRTRTSQSILTLVLFSGYHRKTRLPGLGIRHLGCLVSWRNAMAIVSPVPKGRVQCRKEEGVHFLFINR